jgi:tetratricopeptide (TPR) repeat protein
MSRLNHKDEKRLEVARKSYLNEAVIEACRLYEQLARKNPQHPPIIAELVQIYLRLGRMQLAAPLLERLLEIGAEDFNCLMVAGKGLKKLGKNRLAISAFRMALKLSPPEEPTRQLYLEIGNLSDRINDLESAITAVDSLLKLAPAHPQTQCLAGSIFARTDRLEDAENALRLASSNPKATPSLRCQSTYTLGKVLDHLERFEEAYETLVEAKQIELPQLNEERIKALWMAELIQRLTMELQNHPPSSVNFNRERVPDGFGRPLCFLTGHPRSGTTLLEQMLAAHSKISTADESSAFFHCLVYPLIFPDLQLPSGPAKNPLPRLELKDLQLQNVSPRECSEKIRRYRDQLEWLAKDRTRDHYLIDKSPGGMIDLPVFESALPKTKVIVVLRDPRDICLSCFQQFLGVNLISVNFNTLENTASKIARDLKFWLAFRQVTKLPWIEVRYERLIGNPEAELRRVLGFLNLEWENTTLNFPSAVREMEVHSPSYSEVSQPIHDRSIGRWRNYAHHFAKVETILEPVMKELGFEI